MAALAYAVLPFSPCLLVSRLFPSSLHVSARWPSLVTNTSVRPSKLYICRSNLSAASGSNAALTPELKESFDKLIASHKVLLFMKGTKMFPQCGFSNTIVQILNSLNVPFETVNILENDAIRMGMKEYSNWPTFPQLYIDGEFFGGCDITFAAYQKGELQEVLEKAMCS